MYQLSTSTVTAICFLLFLPFLSNAQAPSPSVPCTPLTSYLAPDSEDELERFLGGGDVPNDVPVFFDIPRMEISFASPQIKFCIGDIPIPKSVGGTACNEWNKCWLVIGTHTEKNLNPDDIEYCESSDKYRGTAPCYECVCSGAELSTGSVADNVTVTDACGLSSQDRWGAVCPDVQNGRMVFPYDGSYPDSYSNYTTVQINICGGISDLCSICRSGGHHPQFQVGLQWTKVAEQCFEEPPFNAGYASTMIWSIKALSVFTMFVANVF